MESPGFKVKKEPFVLSEIVQETVNTFQLYASEKQVNLQCTQCQYHVWIDADIRLMERVIQNLVGNAIRSTPQKGAINVAMEVKNSHLIFRIENDSPPLTEDLLQWINSRENEDGQTLNKPGSGLGLLIVKKILHLHNSLLQAYRTENSGNIFTFGIEVYNRTGNT